MKKRISKSEKGLALIAVVVFTCIFVILGFSMLDLAKTEIIMTKQELDTSKAFYAAEAGIEYGVVNLKSLLSESRQMMELGSEMDIANYYDVSPPELEGFTFETFTIEKVGNLENIVFDSGPFTGMDGYTQRYKITSQAKRDGSVGSSVRLVQWVEDQRLHLFQFAAFYDQDLELEPGKEMTIAGRIHSNHDIFLTSGSTLSIDSYITSAGDIFRTSKPGDYAEEKGIVQVKDENEDYQVMDFDCTDPDWTDKALSTWGGTVRSQDHSTSELNLPISTDFEPSNIIERGKVGDTEALKEASLYWQADIRIIDGVAYNKSGQVIDLPGVIDTSKTFYNYREGKDIKVTEIDLFEMQTSSLFPENGILYISSHLAGTGQQDGVRLVNGKVLPPNGLTVATDNPLYIQGDYNINGKPASVMCDSINILSNAWNDEKKWVKAAKTLVNTSVVAGHTPTTAEGYGGGLENLFRFLEPWSGVTFEWSGSITSLWYSKVGTGKWIYGYPYYTAPVRKWSFDEKLRILSNLPPGAPLVCISSRSNWQEESSL
jgi:Tfp pilus assembly protein PilX